MTTQDIFRDILPGEDSEAWFEADAAALGLRVADGYVLEPYYATFGFSWMPVTENE